MNWYIHHQVLLLFAVLLFGVSNTYAQTPGMAGKVIDSYDSVAVPQVNISIFGSDKGTATNTMDTFYLHVTAGDTLVFYAVQ